MFVSWLTFSNFVGHVINFMIIDRRLYIMLTDIWFQIFKVIRVVKVTGSHHESANINITWQIYFGYKLIEICRYVLCVFTRKRHIYALTRVWDIIECNLWYRCSMVFDIAEITRSSETYRIWKIIFVHFRFVCYLKSNWIRY